MIARRNALIISTVYIVLFIGGLILIPSMIIILLFGALGLALISLSFIIWIFITIYKGKIIPEINSLIIGIGFITYLIFMIFYPFSIYILKNIPIHGDGIGGLIMETVSLISFMIIIIGFKTKASY